jgi:hypothetical protein
LAELSIICDRYASSAEQLRRYRDHQIDEDHCDSSPALTRGLSTPSPVHHPASSHGLVRSQIELRALAAAKRSEKTAERELKEAAKAAEPKKKSKPLSSRGDVVVEEVGSDEEDLYEGRIEEEEEADSNEMTDHTPETRNAVRATPISLSPSLSLCL